MTNQLLQWVPIGANRKSLPKEAGEWPVIHKNSRAVSTAFFDPENKSLCDLNRKLFSHVLLPVPTKKYTNPDAEVYFEKHGEIDYDACMLSLSQENFLSYASAKDKTLSEAVEIMRGVVAADENNDVALLISQFEKCKTFIKENTKDNG